MSSNGWTKSLFKSWIRSKSDKAKRRPFRKALPRVEQLEVRAVPAGSINLSSNVLLLADTGAPTITAAYNAGTQNYTITDSTGLTGTITGWTISGNTATENDGLGASITQLSFQTTNAAFSGVVASATAPVSIADTATATITGANSFSGGLFVQGGTLQIGSASALPAATPVTVASGAALDLAGNSVSIGSLNGAGIVENAASFTTATLAVTAGGSFSGVVQDDAAHDSATALEVDGGTLTLSGANSFTGGLTIRGGTFVAGGDTSGITGAAGNTNSPIQLGTGTTASASLEAGTFTVANPINMGSAGALTLGNDGGSDDAYFSGAITLNGNALTIATTGTSTSSRVIASGSITGIGNLVLNNLSAGGSIWLGFPPPSDVHAGPPHTPNDINNAGSINNIGTSTGLTTISNTIKTQVTGVIENTSAVAASPLVLAGANTFTSGVTVLGGTVDAAQTSQALGVGAVTLGNTVSSIPAALLISTSFLQFSNPIQLAANANLSGVGGLTIGSTQAVTIGRPTDATATFSGGVTGTNNLTINVGGNGNLIFDGSPIGISGTITNNGTGIGTTVISSNLPGSVTGVTENGTSNLILSGTNANTGPDTITAGELSIEADANLGSGNSIVLNGGTLEITGTALTSAVSGMIGSHPYSINSGSTAGFDINDPNNTFTISDALTQGAGGLTKLGAGTLVLANANTYTGTTLIGGGTLRLGNGGTTGSLSPSSTIVDNSAGSFGILTTLGTLAIDRSNTVTQGTDFSGSGIGTIQLTGTTSSTGSTAHKQTITGLASTALLAPGMSVSGSGIPAGAKISAILSATSIQLTAAATATQTGVTLTFTETGGLANVGSGTTILTAANSYSGPTYIYSGVLQVGNSGTTGTLGTGPVIIGSGNLVFDRSDTVTVSNVIQNLTGGNPGGSAPITTGANPGHDMVQSVNGVQVADSSINIHDYVNSAGQLQYYHWGATGSDRPGQIPVVAPFNPIAVQAVGNTVGSGALFYLTTNESSQFTSPTPTTIPVTYTAGSNTVTLTSGTIAGYGISIGRVVEGAGIVTVPADVNGDGGPGVGTSPTGTFITSVDPVHNTFTLNIAPTASGTSLLLPALANLQANGIGGVQIVSGGGTASGSPGAVNYTPADVGKILTVAQGQGTFSLGYNVVGHDGLATAGSLTPNTENYANPNVTPAQLVITQVTNGQITGVKLVTPGTYQPYAPVVPGDQTYMIPIFTGSVSGTTLTVDSFISGTDAPYAYGFNLVVGQTVFDSNGDSLGTITGQLTGPAGGVGTYMLSQSSAAASDTFSAQTTTSITGSIAANVLTVSSPTGSPIVVGDVIIGPGVPVGTAVTAQLTGTPGGAGTYQLATLTGAYLNAVSGAMTAQLNQTLTTASGAQLPIESNMLSPALTQPTAVDNSDQNGQASGYGSGLGDEITSAYEMTSAHELYAPLTGDTTAGSNVITNVTNNSPAGTPYAVGYAVDGLGIPAGAIITAIGAGGSITLSQAATITAAGSSFDSWNEWTSAIDPNTIAAGGSGYTNGETVVALGGVTAASGAPLLGTVTTSGGVVTGFTASDATNNGFQGDGADSVNWYSVLPTVPIPVTGGSGTGNPLFNLTVNDVLSTTGPTGIAIATVVSGHGGSGYAVGNVLTVGAPAGITPVGTAATLTVTAVDGSGSILAVNVTTAGSYSKWNPATLFYVAPVDGSGGSGAILSWQALQTSVPDNASSNLSPDAGIVNGGGYAVGDVLVVSSPSSWTDSQGNQATWTVAPILQVTRYTYSASGPTFTYNLINTPVSSTGHFPSSSDTFNVFPLGYTPSTTIVGPNTLYGAGVNGGVAEFTAGATVNFGPQVFGATPGSVIQMGSGTTILTGADTYTGATTVSAGKLFVDGSIISSTSVAASATVGGTGTIAAPVAVTGALAAGDTTVASTGSLTVGNLSFGSGGTLDVLMNGTTAGTGYDQVNVNGTVDLTEATLALTAGFTANPGDQFTIINNDGTDAVTGTFTNGSTVTVGGQTFSINYAGGDGNDVVLTRANTTATTVQSVVVGDGTAQRSEVRQIVVTFSGPVTFSGGNSNAAAAFQLLHTTYGSTVFNTQVANLQTAVTTNGSGQTVVTITFIITGNAASEVDPESVQSTAGGPTTPSLGDGKFQLTILAGSVSGSGGALAGDGTTAGTNFVTPAETAGATTGLHLWRLFGDSTGEGIDDLTDLTNFRNTYNTALGNAAYVNALDADNDGVIDLDDLTAFRNHYNHTV
jgi:autotransporter-associated beta strand protein